MLIVSKFHDYYDVGMKMGMDKTCVYQRNTVIIEGKPSIEDHYPSGWRPYVLAFCGKFYPLVYHYNGNGTIDKVIWDAQEAAITLPKKMQPRYWDYDTIDTELGIRRFFDRKYPKLETLYHKYKTPIFGFDPPTKHYSWMRTKEHDCASLMLNPNLKRMKFFKMKDPVTAYQEIYMFMSGVLGSRGPEPLPISDKLKAQAHGHDDPYSFKKAPGEQKRRKNK